MKMVTGLMNSKQEHWIMSARKDLIFLFLPVWILWIVFFSNGDYYSQLTLPLWAWVLFIVGLDVGHVWSTLFRTYLDKEEFQSQKKLLIFAPFVIFIISFGLVYWSIDWFWKAISYFAVFHFIKQQQGFSALFLLKKTKKAWNFISNKNIIYLATLYPVVYWHFNSQSEFNWFIENGFFNLYEIFGNQDVIFTVFNLLNYIYWSIILGWLGVEIKNHLTSSSTSIGNTLWILTTAVNWWFAIVYYNSDVIFSVSNVVAHGVPYIVLIYYYNSKKRTLQTSSKNSILWGVKWGVILLVSIFVIAFIEEYFWDMFIYQDHTVFFNGIFPYKYEQLSQHWSISLGISLLALPQLTHYIIDGYIWKFNTKNKYLKPIFKPNNES